MQKPRILPVPNPGPEQKRMLPGEVFIAPFPHLHTSEVYTCRKITNLSIISVYENTTKKNNFNGKKIIGKSIWNESV